jgi:hypothetical protein
MISMISSTSITSISGVVLMSIITSGSLLAALCLRSLPLHSFRRRCGRRGAIGASALVATWVGDEADLRDPARCTA